MDWHNSSPLLDVFSLSFTLSFLCSDIYEIRFLWIESNKYLTKFYPYKILQHRDLHIKSSKEIANSSKFCLSKSVTVVIQLVKIFPVY